MYNSWQLDDIFFMWYEGENFENIIDICSQKSFCQHHLCHFIWINYSAWSFHIQATPRVMYFLFYFWKTDPVPELEVCLILNRGLDRGKASFASREYWSVWMVLQLNWIWIRTMKYPPGHKWECQQSFLQRHQHKWNS